MSRMKISASHVCETLALVVLDLTQACSLAGEYHLRHLDIFLQSRDLIPHTKKCARILLSIAASGINFYKRRS
jgi:hypothetical protein